MVRSLFFLTVVLILTGIPLADFFRFDKQILLWIHIVLGFLLMVLFGLYIQDHLYKHRKKLFTLHPRFGTGSFFLVSFAVCLATGFVLYLYGGGVLQPYSLIHSATTLTLVVGAFMHLRKTTFLRKK